jgi:hypothetical protein
MLGAALKRSAIYSIGLVCVVIFTGCAQSPRIYKEATLMASGTPNQHLSSGYTSEKINRPISYSEMAKGDEIHFVTFGESLGRVPYDLQTLLAVYRSTELAQIKNFKCLVVYPEKAFEEKLELLKGGSTFNITGQISATGALAGSAWKLGKLDINLDRQMLNNQGRWGSGIYALMSNSCEKVETSPAVLNISSTSQAPTNLRVRTEVRFLSTKLQDELKPYLKEYLR